MKAKLEPVENYRVEKWFLSSKIRKAFTVSKLLLMKTDINKILIVITIFVLNFNKLQIFSACAK